MSEHLDHVVPEPHQIGVVHPVLGAPGGDGHRVGVRGQNHVRGREDAVRLEVGEREGDHQDDEQDDDGLTQTPNYVGEHGAMLAVVS